MGGINNRTKASGATSTTKNNESAIRISNTRFATAHHQVVTEKEIGIPLRTSSPVGFPWWCQRRRRRDRNQLNEVGENVQKEVGYGRLNGIGVAMVMDYCYGIAEKIRPNMFPSKLENEKNNKGYTNDFRSIAKAPNLSQVTLNSITSNNSRSFKKQKRLPSAILQRIVGMLMIEKKRDGIYLHNTQIANGDTRDDSICLHEDNEMEKENINIDCNMDATSTPFPPSTNENNEGQQSNDGDEEKWQLARSSIQRQLAHIVQREQNKRNNKEEDLNICSDSETENKQEMKNGEKNATAVTLHTYQYPPTNPNVTLYGLGISLPKFKAWIAYMLRNNHTFNSTKSATALLDIHKQKTTHHKNSKEIYQYISTENIELNPEKRKELRRQWFARKLISHRTEVLASYPSNQVSESDSNVMADKAPKALQEESVNQSDTTKKQKRGGFNDLLSVYAERLVSILKDEQKDFENGLLKVISEPKPKKNTGRSLRIGESFQKSYYIKGGDNKKKSVSESSKSPDFHLISWLRSEYGISETNQLLHSNFSKLKEKEQLNKLKHFLNWFRENFPYYYDQCGHCNASFRNDSAVNGNEETDNNDSDESDVELDVIDGTFLGYIYPTEDEIRGKASRTELYQCHKCQSYTRFPRYNSISSIVRYGKGRCGEYSILLYRALRDLGHHARWVVDWSDHVWVECWSGEENLVSGRGRWIHLDPCEAACDEPLLYQQWGKKQTLIMAFWVPRQREIYTDFNLGQLRGLPLIEDVTQKVGIG